MLLNAYATTFKHFKFFMVSCLWFAFPEFWIPTSNFWIPTSEF